MHSATEAVWKILDLDFHEVELVTVAACYAGAEVSAVVLGQAVAGSTATTNTSESTRS
ncbi:hypothetical protein [Ciceribacter thiooxidans]|uniref:Uncharacterized protein n=1 Tax=Ciceribacter thiooxidans TaxID=1969821 RepID=A0ABV7I6P6_9HYPH|nr:hypothetical protein [Ciceribacter thiooxidans]